VVYNARPHTAAFSGNDKLPVILENVFEFENEKNFVVVAVNRAALSRTSSATQNWSVIVFL
jgi:hypothetical protein